MPLFTPRLDTWMRDAACAGAAPLFDPDSQGPARARAMSICVHSCPVAEQCRRWAESNAYTGIAAGKFYRSGTIESLAS